MLGTLQLARALTDRDLSDQLLARGVDTAMRLLNEHAAGSHARPQQR
jgi:TetR/AcrR family transcriptional repressor of nem operon